ncbi:MAG: MG2 domain-containing protein [Desulfobacterium sp.]|nr:MG2 domain-containing protein [Desulfobacterium sp.]
MKSSLRSFFPIVPFALFLFLMLFLSVQPCLCGDSLKITRITPRGMDVPEKRQITVEFNKKVVPLGKMERDQGEIPIAITPRINGQWRWLTPSTLALELDEQERLKPATLYTLTVLPGIMAEDGSTLVKPHVHSFTTLRPKVRYTGFKTWNSPGTPVLRVVFNQPVLRDSLNGNVFFKTDDPDRRQTGGIAAPDPDDIEYPVDGRGENGVDLDQEENQNDQNNHARRIWLVSPVEELPHDTQVTLRLRAGLKSPLGPVPGVADSSLVKFHTFPEFKFIGLEAYSNNGDDPFLLGTDVSLNETLARPNPLAPMALLFSTPVSVDDFRKSMEFYPSLAGPGAGFDPWANVYSYSGLGFAHKKGQTYRISLPVSLMAHTPYRVKESLLRLRDQFGRRLVHPLDFSFHTDHRPPDYKLVYDTAVLEQGVKNDLPLVVTNLEGVTVNYRRMTVDATDENLELQVQTPGVEDLAVKIPLGVDTMLGNRSGALYGTMNARPGVDKSDWEKTFFVQRTPFEVQVKSGHFNTLVWVVDLATGEPVADACVTLYKGSLTRLKGDGPALATGVTDEAGISMLPGTSTLDPELKMFDWSWANSVERFFIKVVKDGHMALLPLSPKFETDTYRASGAVFSSSLSQRYSHIHTWGTTAQGIYRAGDTIEFKIYVRDQDNGTFIQPPRNGYTLKIIDPTGKTVHEQESIKLSRFGAFDGRFTTSKTAGVGYYQFELSADFTEIVWAPLKVLVGDFVPAPFRVTTEINTTRLTPGQKAEITTTARLHAGGPYTDASTRVVARLEPLGFVSTHALVKDFWFQTDQPDLDEELLLDTRAVLDSQGVVVTGFDLSQNLSRDPVQDSVRDIVPFGRVIVESAVRDDRGGSIAATTSVEFFGRDRFVGLRSDSWLYYQGDRADFPFVVVDDRGEPVPGIDTRFSVERLVTKASRVKGAGNAFQTLYVDEWIEVAALKKVSGKEPLFIGFTPDRPGAYRLRATIKDTEEREQTSALRFWVAGGQRVTWHEPESQVLTLIAEQDRLEVGDTARYMVKNPFPGARALVTVERYGVLKQWIMTLEGSTPVVEFPVEPQFAPGFFLSITVVSPRVAAPPDNGADNGADSGELDLGKPVSRLGYHRVEVVDPNRRIKVDVGIEKESYKPGDTVKVDLSVDNGKEPVEIAVAVLDEAVFDLLGRDSGHFDPFKGFYTIDGLDLVNYSLMKRLVGIQKFSKKGASPGGDGGGVISMRSVFKYVSYWNPSIPMDSEGRAGFQFKVPDNLTGWRVFAMAVTPTDRMGTGEKGFKVNLPTEVRPVMPNQVLKGDSFKAGFSIMNRTDQERELTVRIEAMGDNDHVIPPVTETLFLPPFKRETVWMEITAEEQGEIRFRATAGDGLDGDAVEHRLLVNDRNRVTTVAAYGSMDRSGVTQTFKVPQEIRTDLGFMGAVLSPSVIGTLEPALTYMRDYPFTCWEQLLSRALVAAMLPDLEPWLSTDGKQDGDFGEDQTTDKKHLWDRGDEFVQEILDRAVNFQAPNGGMGYFSPDQERVSPYLSAFTALAFTELRAGGYKVPEVVEQKLHAFVRTLLQRDVMPQFYSSGMRATVRAVALNALANGNRGELDELLRLFVHLDDLLDDMSLFGRAMLLEAALSTPGADQVAEKCLSSILSHSNRTGGKVSFSETLDTGYRQIAATPTRANSALLSALVKYAAKKKETNRNGTNLEEINLTNGITLGLVRYLTDTRKGRTHWENTQDTLFAIRGLLDYAQTFEGEKTSMEATVLLDGQSLGRADFNEKARESVRLVRPMKPDDPGTSPILTVEKKGEGRLYFQALMAYAPKTPPEKSLNAGISVERRVWVEENGKPVRLHDPVILNPGDLVRVDLLVSPGGARNFVIVEDPVPGGLEPVNRSFATSSAVEPGMDEADPDFLRGQHHFYHRELTHGSVRFYSERVPPGSYRLSYTAQAISRGHFAWPAVRAMEMYDTDIFGRGVETLLVVAE